MAKYVYPAIFQPEDVLPFYLYDLEVENKEIPKPSKAEEVKVKQGEFVNYIACDTVEYAKIHSNRAVKKTLTIPEWLNDAAMKQNINFSQVLQEALMKKVN